MILPFYTIDRYWFDITSIKGITLSVEVTEVLSILGLVKVGVGVDSPPAPPAMALFIAGKISVSKLSSIGGWLKFETTLYFLFLELN